MTRALIAVGLLLGLAFAVLGLVVFLARDEDRVAVDNVLALELTRAIGTTDEIDLRTLAKGDWDRVIVATPGTSDEDLSTALGSPYRGDLPYGQTGPLFVFAAGERLVRFADYRGNMTFDGFGQPLEVVPRERALLTVRDGVATVADAR